MPKMDDAGFTDNRAGAVARRRPRQSPRQRAELAVQDAYTELLRRLGVPAGSEQDVAWRRTPMLRAAFPPEPDLVIELRADGSRLFRRTLTARVDTIASLSIVNIRPGRIPLRRGVFSTRFRRRDFTEAAAWYVAISARRCVYLDCLAPVLNERTDYATGLTSQTTHAICCEKHDRDIHALGEYGRIQTAVSRLRAVLGLR
jgi:hypothetical protein